MSGIKQVIEMDEEAFGKAIDDKLSKIVTDAAYARFEGRKVCAATACDILDISKRTLYRYIGAGVIHPVDRDGDENYKFNLRSILEFNMLKHKHIKTWKDQNSRSGKRG